MTAHALREIFLYLAALTLLAAPLGSYLHRVMQGLRAQPLRLSSSGCYTAAAELIRPSR